MRIRDKTFVIIGIAWSAFLTFAYTEEIQESWVNFLMLAILFSFLLFFIMQVLITRRIQLLNQQLSQINFHHKKTAYLDIKGKDEVAAVALQINALLVLLHTLQQQVAHAEKAKLKQANIHINTNLKLNEVKKETVKNNKN